MKKIFILSCLLLLFITSYSQTVNKLYTFDQALSVTGASKHNNSLHVPEIVIKDNSFEYHYFYNNSILYPENVYCYNTHTNKFIFLATVTPIGKCFTINKMKYQKCVVQIDYFSYIKTEYKTINCYQR